MVYETSRFHFYDLLIEVRSSLSQSALRRTSWEPAGAKTRTKPSYADARLVNRSRLLATGGGASRRTTSITIGSGFAEAAVSDAEGPSPSCRYFLFHTRITACWPGARPGYGALWSTVRGKRQRRSSRMLIGCPIRPRCAAGRLVWMAPGHGVRFSIRSWPA